MWRYLRWVLLGFAVLLAIVVALPFFLPTGIYKDQIVAQARDATGRDLAIDGPLRISFFPELAVEVNQVRFANAAGGKAADMATIERLVVGAELFPLLSGQVKVTHITLVKPIINLEIDATGRGNWVFDSPSARAPAAAPTKDEPARGSGLGDLSFKDVTLSGGTLTYRDARSKMVQSVENIEAAVQLPSLDEPMIVSGALTWNKENVKIEASVAEPRALSEGRKSALSAKVNGDVIAASFNGSLHAGIGAVGGKVDLKTASARRLAAWFGVTLPQVRGFGPMTLSGDMTSSAGRVSFANAKLSLDGMKGSGNLALDTTAAKPFVKGDFALDRLDLNQYAGSGKRSGGAGSGSGSAPGVWSDTPFSFSALNLVDADLDFAADSLQYRDINVGRSALDIALRAGKLEATLKQLDLYGGHGTGSVSLDGSKDLPAVTLYVTLSGVQSEPFLDDATGFNKIEGAGNFVVRVSGTGGSERALMHSVDGAMNFRFTNGSVRGADLGEIAHHIESALDGSAIGDNARTSFSELSGSFGIRNGIAANRDLKLINPYVHLNGAGIANIGEKTLDFRVEPKAVGKSSLTGIVVPFRIYGSWKHPQYKADLGGVVNSAIDAILQGKGSDLGGLIPGLGGGDDQPSDDQATQKPKKKSKTKKMLDKLDKFLGGH